MHYISLNLESNEQQKCGTMKRISFIFALIFAALAVVPQSQAQLRRANRALERGEIEEAMSLAQELLADKPDDHRTWDLLARVHDAQASQSSMDEYLGHIGEMAEAYRKVIELDPGEAEGVIGRLQIFYMQTFNSGITEFNNGQSVAGDDALQAEHFQNSARHFQATAIVFPDSSGSYVNWAYALLGAGDSDAAIEPLKLALEKGGPDPELYSFLARIYLTSDRAEEAVPLLEEASGHFPNNAELQNYLLNAYSETGQDDRALETYGNAVANNPENPIYRYNYGSLLLQAERFDEAIEELREATTLEEGYVDAYYNLGAAYINKANAIQQQINTMDDDMRERRDELSDEEESGIMADIDVLIAERRGLYEEAIIPLEAAKEYAEMEEGRSVEAICAALFQAYAQTGQEDKAELVQECAGM